MDPGDCRNVHGAGPGVLGTQAHRSGSRLCLAPLWGLPTLDEASVEVLYAITTWGFHDSTQDAKDSLVDGLHLCS